jgi:hypothetical protein
VNDKPVGIAWRPPFRVDITDAAKPGANKVEVRVTNVWKNRLIGDQKLPQKDRITWTFYPFYKADAPLVESGLLGPVRVLSTGGNKVPTPVAQKDSAGKEAAALEKTNPKPLAATTAH